MPNRYHMVLAALVLAVGCAGCGTAAPPAHSGFVLSQAGSVVFLAWTAQSGQINGTYTVTTPQNTQTASVTGQQPNAGSVTLQVEGIGEMSGTVSGATMQTNGRDGVLTWYAATRQQAAQIQATYRAYQTVQTDASTLQNVEGSLPNNSFPGYYQAAVQGAMQRVTDEQNALTAIQQQNDAMNRCMYLEAFTANFPAAAQDSELHLPFSLPGDTSAQAVVDRSDLSTTITLLSNDFRVAQALPLPSIRGLPLTWKVDVSPRLAQARQQLSTLQQTILSVAPQIPPEEQQAAQIQAQVAAIQKQHQCFD